MTNNFCSAPFVHMYVHSNEGERICCMSTEQTLFSDTTELDLKSRWESEKYRNIREQFLNNEQPDICTKCFDLEKTGGISDRIRFNDLYLDTLIPNVKTGNQHDTPYDLDIRPGNLCNLRCRMCGPISSSQLQKEAQSNPKLGVILGAGIFEESDVLERPENFEYLLSNIEHSRRIKFLGGEPTIMPEVDKILDMLIEREIFDIPIHFTTNCTNGNQRFIDKIKHFKNVSFNYSVDGVGSVVEYIRDPVKFNSINTNIQTYHSIAWYGQISYALQAYNFFNLLDTVKWSKSLDIVTRPEILRMPEWASYRNIPLNIRRKRLELMLKMPELTTGKHKDTVLPVLEQMLDDDTVYDIHNFVMATKLYDKSRKQHIKNYIPEVWDFIKEDYNALQI